MKKGFNPTEIIFCPTSECNLNCSHCFVNQSQNILNTKAACDFLECCINQSCNQIEKIGFSGGEPFLNLDFVCEICKKTVNHGLLFDRLMTNGLWWKTEEELKAKLQQVYDAGFDGKIGLSWDCFHGFSVQKAATFINACFDIFNDESCVEILSVIPSENKKQEKKEFEQKLEELLETIGKESIRVYRFAQSFLPEENSDSKQKLWHDKKWFKDDFCQATGNVFYVHADGKIAPCCGFANECKELIIGTVNDDYETLMKNASENKIVNLCYEKGLYNLKKELKKSGKLPKGRCNDMCQFCAWICSHKALF